MQESNGKKLQGMSPTKSTEEKTGRELGRRTIKRAIRKCMKANVAIGKNRTKCIRRRGVDLSKFVRGDKKNEAPDTSNAELEDARAFMYRCMKKKFLTKTDKDCRKEFIKRLKQTRQCDPSTGPASSRTCPMAKCSAPPKGCKAVDKFEMTSSGHCCPRQCYYEDANGKSCSDSTKKEDKKEDETNDAAEETARRHAALNYASDLSDIYENIGTMTKKEKLDTRESMKKDLEYSGIPEREVPIFQSTGAKLNVIHKTADAKKAGLDDKAVEEVTKTAMEDNEDCDDYNADTKNEITTAADAVVKGGLPGDLKLKPNKTVTVKVCRKEKELTLEEVKSMVTDNKDAKSVIDETTVKKIKTPKQDSVSKETCAACSYSPKKGQTAAKGLEAFEKLKAKARRALRMLVGRELASSDTTTSTGETNLIVPGDDDSVATNPAGGLDVMLIVGLVIGCLCVLALVVLIFMVVNKKKRKKRGKEPAYKPHAEQQGIEMQSNPLKK